MKTINRYCYPIDLRNIKESSYTKSPAHSISYKNGMYNKAIDFICDEGLFVIASLDGEIIEVVCNHNVGGNEEKYDMCSNYIEIRHQNDEYSEYEHLMQNSALVKVGDKVVTGQNIAKTGATGWLGYLGPHLHFMVGKYKDNYEDYKH